MSFTVDDGWAVDIPDLPHVFALSLTNESFDQEFCPLVTFALIEEVFEDEGDFVPMPAPDDLLGWYMGRSELEVGQQADTTIGGLVGEQIDTQVVAESRFAAGSERFFVGPVDGEPLWHPVGESLRVRVVQIDQGPDLVVTVEMHPDDVAGVLGRVETLLETVTFAGL